MSTKLMVHERCSSSEKHYRLVRASLPWPKRKQNKKIKRERIIIIGEIQGIEKSLRKKRGN